MKKIIPVILAIALFASLGSVALAAKPVKNGADKDVITLSNGFPSGVHYNLNIHGKQESYACVPYDQFADSHNVVNIPEYGEGTITYVSGKKVKIDELTVFDACTESFDEDPAEVWLPYEAEGYYVFARALGKPAKGNPNEEGYEPRSIIIENDEFSPIVFSLFGDVSNPDEVPLMLPLGLITQGGDYEIDSTDDAGINLVRFDSEPAGKGRGKTLGKDITDMFMWTGWIFNPILDVNLDGLVNEMDVIADNCTADTNHDGTVNQTEWEYLGFINAEDAIAATCYYDLNVNGAIDPEEFQAWLDDNIGDPEDPLWYHYEKPIWVFNIADLVYHNQVYMNNGIKNLQVRFYPVATTEFGETPE